MSTFENKLKFSKIMVRITWVTLVAIMVVVLSVNCIGETGKGKQKDNSSVPFLNELKSKRDSVQSAKLDSLAQLAWGDARFGMSQKEVMETSLFKDASVHIPKNTPFSSLWLYSSSTQIDEIQKIGLSFFNDRLYRVEVEGSHVTLEDYDKVRSDIGVLHGLISEKYGNPDKNRGMPGFSSMKLGYLYMVYQWDVGKKIIKVVVETSRSREYWAKAIILNNTENDIVEQYNDSINRENNAEVINPF